MTFYECLAKIFDVIDAIFTIDEDDYLGIEFFNDNARITVLDKITAIKLQLGEERYNNGLVSDYSNARVLINYPTILSNNLLQSTPKGVGIASEFNWEFKTQKPIEYIRDLWVKPYYENFIGDPKPFAINISKYVVDKETYDILPSKKGYNQSTDYKTLYKQNTIYYERGKPNVFLGTTYKGLDEITYSTFINAIESVINDVYGRTFSRGGTDTFDEITGCQYSISYYGTTNGRVKAESNNNKYKGEIYIKTESSKIDLPDFGNNLFGKIQQMGENDLTLTQEMVSYDRYNEVKKGDIYKYGLDDYIVNIVETKFYNDFIRKNIKFTRNFNQLSLRTQLDQQKRFFEINNTLVNKSTILLTEYIYLDYGEVEIDYGNISLNNLFFWGAMETIFSGSTSAVNSPVDLIYISSNELNSNVYVPFTAYPSGNMICYEMSYDNPISAGTQTTDIEKDKAYTTTYVPYTKESGELEKSSLTLLSMDNEYSFNRDEFPEINETAIDEKSVFKGKIENLKIYKQPNEIFGLNYQICFLPKSDKTYISRYLIDNNPLLIQGGFGGRVKVFVSTQDNMQIPFYCKKISQLDYVSEIELISRDIDDFEINTHKAVIRLRLGESLQNKSYTITDSKGNILFINNEQNNDTNNIIMTFYTSAKRL